MKKILTFFFPKNENFLLSLVILPLKLLNCSITIICFIVLSPLFVINGLISLFNYIRSKYDI